MFDEISNIASILGYLVEKVYFQNYSEIFFASDKRERTKSVINRSRALRKCAKIVASNFRNKEALKIFSYHLYLYAYDAFTKKIENYMLSTYLSKDYDYFKKLHPIEVVRMVRFYANKEKAKLPQNLTPLLLKKARNLKRKIQTLINYYSKKNPIFPKDQIFEEVKIKYYNKMRAYELKPKMGKSLRKKGLEELQSED